MKITFPGCGDAERTTVLEVLTEDAVRIDDTVYQIPADLVTIDATGLISSGYRDANGTVHLVVQGRYHPDDAVLWETKPHRGTYEEDFLPTLADFGVLMTVVCTGKTQADLDAKANADAIAGLKAQLAALDIVIPRSTEDLYAAVGIAPFPAVQATIQKKIEIRTQLKDMGA